MTRIQSTGSSSVPAVVNFSQSGGTITCNLALATHFRGQLTASVTSIVFTNTPAAGFAAEGTILFIQPSSGSPFTADFSAWKWESAAAPLLSTSINTSDRVGFFITQDGTQGTGIFKDVR